MSEFEHRETQGRYCPHCKVFLGNDALHCQKCGQGSQFARAIVYSVTGTYSMTEMPDLIYYLMERERMLAKYVSERGGITFSQGDSMEYMREYGKWAPKEHEAYAAILKDAFDRMYKWNKENPEPEKRRK